MIIPIIQREFDKLVNNLKAGTFTVVASSDSVEIRGVYVTYSLAR